MGGRLRPVPLSSTGPPYHYKGYRFGNVKEATTRCATSLPLFCLFITPLKLCTVRKTKFHLKGQAVRDQPYMSTTHCPQTQNNHCTMNRRMVSGTSGRASPPKGLLAECATFRKNVLGTCAITYNRPFCRTMPTTISSSYLPYFAVGLLRIPSCLRKYSV